MPIKLKTPPIIEPVALSEAKAYLRITDAVDDAVIGAMIAAARRACEEFTGRALITQSWTLWLDRFPCDEQPGAPLDGYYEVPINYYDRMRRHIEIPRPPLQSVAFLKTYDVADVATVFNPSNYLVDTATEPGRIALNFGSIWPVVLRWYNAVQVEFVAGYGDTAASVPDNLKQGMLILIKTWFVAKSKLFEPDESGAGVSSLTTAEGLPHLVKTLWQPYRVGRI